MSPGLVFGIMFASLLILILLRVPVSFALAISVVPILMFTPSVTPIMLLQRMMNQFGSFILLAIPFFILAANLMNTAGITDQLLRFSQSLVGWMPGGLGHINVLVSMIFAGISGSSNADAAGIGSVIIPAMEKEGYDTNFTVAVTACSSVMGVIIPPSITMVVWGGTMNVSVAALFIAGIIPGILIGGGQMIVVYLYAKKRNYPKDEAFSLRRVWDAFKSSLLALLSPLIIIGGIVGGFVTPTEASLIAVLYSLFVGVFLLRTVTAGNFARLLVDAMKLSAIVLFAVGTAAIYSWVLAYYKVPGYLVNIMADMTTSPTIMLMLIVVVFLIAGMFIDAVPAIIIFGPLLRPLADSVGIHPIQFALIGCVTLAYGLVTPPYGLCLLITSQIAKINCMTPLKEVGVFLLAMLAVLTMMVFIPAVTLGLPKFFMPALFR